MNRPHWYHFVALLAVLALAGFAIYKLIHRFDFSLLGAQHYVDVYYGCATTNEDGELDPFIIEQHKMILDAFIRLHEHISRTTTTRTDKMNALRDISTLYSITVDEYGTAVLHNFMSTLPIALKVNLKEDVFKFVDNFKGRCVSFTNSQSFVSQKEMIKEELDRDLFSTEVYKDFLSALEIASDVSFYKFPSPALICSHWKDYKEVL